MIPRILRGRQSGNIAVGLLYIAVVIAIIYGWFANLFAAVSMIVHDAPLHAMFLGRIIGIFVFPLGVILGYC